MIFVLDATLRQFRFLLKGLQQVQRDCAEKNIRFHLLLGSPPSVLPEFIEKHRIGGIVADFAPLRVPLKWMDDLLKKIPEDIPVCQVDAHNIVPCWETSDKLEYAARTIRPKITKQLPTYLTHFPPVIYHPHNAPGKPEPIDWQDAEDSLECDRSLDDIDWAEPGTLGGLRVLHTFVTKKLKDYHVTRNDPSIDGISNLSPWFHFGQIAPQRAALGRCFADGSGCLLNFSSISFRRGGKISKKV